MVIVMQEGATDAQIQHVIDRLVASGFNVHRSTGESHTVLGAVGVHRDFDHRDFELLDGVRASAARKWSSPPAPVRSNPASKSIPLPQASPRPARRSCAAAPSSRALLLTPSKAWVNRASSSCAKPPTNSASSPSAK